MSVNLTFPLLLGLKVHVNVHDYANTSVKTVCDGAFEWWKNTNMDTRVELGSSSTQYVDQISTYFKELLGTTADNRLFVYKNDLVQKEAIANVYVSQESGYDTRVKCIITPLGTNY